MFIGYVDKTTKQYKVYIPDLQTTVRSSIVDFEEETKGRTVDLNLPGEYLQDTSNILTVRKLIERPKELIPVVELPFREKLNNFKIVIPLQKPESILSQPTNPTKGEDKTPAQDPAQDPDQESAQDPAQEQPAPLQQMPVTGLYNLQKHN